MDPIYYFYVLLAIQEPIRRSLQVRNCPQFFYRIRRKLSEQFHLAIVSRKKKKTPRSPSNFVILHRVLEETKERSHRGRTLHVERHRRGYQLARNNVGLGAKVRRRRVGPRTTGTLQFRGVGVMKAIIQRARGRDGWYRPRVKRKKKSKRTDTSGQWRSKRQREREKAREKGEKRKREAAYRQR